MRRRLLIAAIVLVLLTPFVLLGVVLYTQTGLALVAGQLWRLERLGVHITGLSGTLSGPLRIELFELDHPRVHIVVHDIVIETELRGLLIQTLEVTGEVKPGEQTFLSGVFRKRIGPQLGKPWENSLGMKFVPVGDVLVSVWPTRVKDFDAFCAATNRQRQKPDFPQDANHPVVLVNYEDATEFCEWLTRKEQDAEKLADGQLYRLPRDLEWSQAAGLPDEGRNTPEERDGKIREFIWGKHWPPPPGSGNFADTAARRGAQGAIAGYHDGFAQTSPVGSFAANPQGLFDLSGNVWQWIIEPYNPASRWGGSSRSRKSPR